MVVGGFLGATSVARALPAAGLAADRTSHTLEILQEVWFAQEADTVGREDRLALVFHCGELGTHLEGH